MVLWYTSTSHLLPARVFFFLRSQQTTITAISLVLISVYIRTSLFYLLVNGFCIPEAANLKLLLFVYLLNPLSAKLSKWPNTLKQFVANLPTNCLSVFGHFVRLALKGLRKQLTVRNYGRN